jgi:hypothetical protein
VLALLGLLLVAGPWTPMWTVAACSVLPRWWAGWALSGWVRGLASGLGAVDLVVAVQWLRAVQGAIKKAASGMPPAERPGRAAQGEERRGE